MVKTSRRRDNALIDAIEAIPAITYTGAAWRVVAEGRDPLMCNKTGGRWDDGTFDVLYTSLEADGARAEMYFHLKRGQPIFPSRVRYELHELRVVFDKALRLLDMTALTALGLSAEVYGRASYEERETEYPRTQDIAEVAHFLDYDGLLVPSARWRCQNAVVFCDRTVPEKREVVHSHGLIDWRAWEATKRDEGTLP